MQNLDEIAAKLTYYGRQRAFAIKMQRTNNLATGAYLRTILGWSLAIPKAEQERIRKRASDLLKIGEKLAKQNAKPSEKRKYVEGSEDEDFVSEYDLIMANIQGRSQYDVLRKISEKEMECTASQLPISEFIDRTRGFGLLSAATIVGEAGNLSNYPKKGHLWKRMGVAVIGGKAQGKPGSKASSQDWIEHGYDRHRRSKLYTIGDTLVKCGGHYRSVYLTRKQYERDMAELNGLKVMPAAKITEKNKETSISDMHIHRRSQRYMEKMLLRDLLSEWKEKTRLLQIAA